MISKVVYQGDLRTKCTHIKSGDAYLTDAPVDNNGKGEAFSPTDSVATALASCMLTIMGIKAKDMQLNMGGTEAVVVKKMGVNPRRITCIEISIALKISTNEKNKAILEKAARSCPVLHSLHPEIEKKLTFNWP